MHIPQIHLLFAGFNRFWVDQSVVATTAVSDDGIRVAGWAFGATDRIPAADPAGLHFQVRGRGFTGSLRVFSLVRSDLFL